MEMTDRRWFALVAVICVTIAALRLPPRPQAATVGSRSRSYGDRTPDSPGRLKDRISRLNENAVLLARRDSLLTAAASPSSSTAPKVIITAKLTAAESLAFMTAVAAQSAAIGPAARNIVVGIVVDTSTAIPARVPYRTERQFLLPAVTNGQTCITIIRIGRGRRALDPDAEKGILGPCAFYVSFGAPGPAVEEWLRKRGYDVAYNAAWPAGTDPDPGLLVLRKTTLEQDLRRWLDVGRNFRALDLSACSGGNVDFCSTIMHTNRRSQTLLANAVITEHYSWDSDWSLGPAVESYLADLLAVYGRERFEKFWKSNGDLDSAFRASFGESTGSFTMRWMQYHYGRDSRGPAVPARSALFTIVASLGMAAAGAAVASHREAV